MEFKQHGAFTQLVALPTRILYRLPDALSFEQAAMVGTRFDRRPRRAAHENCSGLDRRGHRQRDDRAARHPGVALGGGKADYRGRSRRQPAGAGAKTWRHPCLELWFGYVAAELSRLTGGLGTEVAFEVVGFTPTLNLALGVLKRGGSCVLVGNLSPRTQDFPLQAMVTKELTLLGSCGSAGEYPLCLDLIARGMIDVQPMIEAVVPLADETK